MREAAIAEGDADQHRAEHAGAGARRRCAALRVADVDERQDGGADDGQDLGDADAAVDAGQGVVVLGAGLDQEDADDRRQQADGHDRHREHQPAGRDVRGRGRCR